jgi:hypothetical protein
MSEMSEHKMSIDEFAELYGRDKPADELLQAYEDLPGAGVEV